MAEHLLSKRRLVLVIIAVGIPSLALIGLGIGLILQESQLEKARLTEAFDETFSLFSASLAEIARENHEEAASKVIENNWSTEELRFDSTVVLLARVDQNELRLPWQLNGSVDLFNRKIHSGQFGRALLRAERLEFTTGAADQAVRAYRTVISTTQDTLQRAYSQLSLARVLDKSNQESAADVIRLEVLGLPANISDDFGVPLFLYAAQQLVQNKEYSNSVEEVLLANMRFPVQFSPQAAYLYRAIHDSLSVISGTRRNPEHQQRLADIEAYAQTTLSSIRLQEDFKTVYPRLISQSGAHDFGLYANDHWLLSISSDSSRSDGVLVVLDADKMVQRVMDLPPFSTSGYGVQVLSSESSPPNKWLGPPFPGIYSQLTTLEAETNRQGFKNRISFIILAMALIIGLMTLGFYLWWRDTRRELVTAKLRSDFVSSVSHELKTPLTSIRMFAETLRFRSPPDEIRDDYLDTIINESSRLTRLLNNVLDFSKIEKDSKDYHLQPVVLERVVFTALQAMEYPFRAQNFEVRALIEDSDIQVSGDPDALEQVVLNLLTNALKFSIDRTEIEIGIRKEGNEAELWVTDWGIGINSDDVGQVFRDYYRAENAIKINAPGTGLGLSLVQHVVEAHGGQVNVRSTLGEGSTFSVKLPLL